MSSLTELAKTLTANAVRAGTLERFAKLSKKLHVLADGEIARLQAAAPPPACKPGCNYCCRNMVPATYPELVEIAELVQGWTPERKKDFERRVAEYQTETGRYWRGETKPFNATCAFLEDGVCSIYDHRPLYCRGRSSYDPSECLAAITQFDSSIPEVPGQMDVYSGLVDSVTKGFQEANRTAGTYELGPSVVQFLSGEFRLPRKYQIRAGADGEVPHRMDLFQIRMTVGEMYETHGERPGTTPLAPLFDLELPVVYASQEQLERSWEVLNQGLNRFCEAKLDPAQAFQALTFANLFYLPYAGKDVKPFLSRFMEHCSERFAKRVFPELTQPLPGTRKPGRFRLGYASGRLTNYNGSRWALGWLAHQSPDIETFAFNLEPKEDGVSLRWRRLADHYYHAPAGAAEVSQFLRGFDLDGLIFTDPGDDGTTRQLSLLRSARWQMTAWGRAITSGSPEMDFYLSSEEWEPSNGDEHYVERLVRLPGSGLYLESETAPPSTKSREELGLPDAFYFIAQNPGKLLPSRDSIWKEISDRTGKPILICSKVSEELAGQVVYRRMLAAGVNIRLLPRVPLEDFLRIAQLADVVLDSFDYSGGITTIQLLGVGCPVVTCPGEFMRGRMAIPFLKQAGVSGLIARDESDFVDIACDLERIAAASAGLDASGIYRDLRAIRALDEFLLGLSLDRQ